jgi:hypothetical protein
MTVTLDEPTTDECLDAAQVQVGTANGPGIYLAPANTDPPPDTESDWPAPWQCLGYLSDDGPTVGQSTDTEDLTPWQSVVPIRTVITSRGVTLQFVLWQLNERTLSLYFDTDMAEPEPDGSLDMDVRTDSAGHTYAVGIDSRDGNRVIRITFFRANLSDAGDMPIQRGAVVPLDCTMSALESNGRLCNIKLGPSNGQARMVPSRNGTNGPSTVEQHDAPARAAARTRGGGGTGQRTTPKPDETP